MAAAWAAAALAGMPGEDPNSTFGPQGKAPFFGMLLCITWAIPALIFWLLDHCLRTRRRVDLGVPIPRPEAALRAEPAEQLEASFECGRLSSLGSRQEELEREREVAAAAAAERDDGCHPGDGGEIRVLLASLEHILALEGGARAKVVAGGLGKVVGLVAEHHPTDVVMVHPMIAEESWSCASGHSYTLEEVPDEHQGCPGCGHAGRPGQPLRRAQDARYMRETLTVDAPLTVTVDGEREIVKVYGGAPPGARPAGRRVSYLLLSHPLFERRTKAHIYPNPMTRREVLRFYSLWSQAVGALLVRVRPAIYHCPDFHAAPAVLYALPEHPDLRVLLCIHNAEYQGQANTDQLRGEKLTAMAAIWNVSEEAIMQNFVKEGRFNLLRAAVAHLEKYQRGRGVYAVSAEYAAECHSTVSLFWGLPWVRGIDNPMLEAERPRLGADETLTERKAAAKAAIQARFGLNVDPQAKLFVSLGRMVRQKGVDILADVAPQLLRDYPRAQLVVIGPPSDGFGVYAASKLSAMMEGEEAEAFRGRAYFEFAFVAVGADLKFAADFCLMPSREEPFGYVDVEFAWHGAALVGAEAGGLGKVPGFYYRAQNRENLPRLRRELRRAVQEAMEAAPEELAEMQLRAREVSFPLPVWQETLLQAYRELRQPPAPARLRPAAVWTFSPAAGELEPGISLPELRPEELADEAAEPPLRVALGGAGAAAASRDAEFLKQELSEEELNDAMKLKMACSPHADIIEILDSIGLDTIKKYETDHGYWWGHWLAGSTFGVARVHWLVACGYVVAPVANTLGFVMCTEWGQRGTFLAPSWLKAAVGIDPVILSKILFSVNAAGGALGTPVWAQLCRRYEPRRVMAAALLLQVPLSFAISVMEPRLISAAVLMFCYGFVSGSGLLFIVFNFMLSVAADMSTAAIRMGFLEVVRYIFMWLATAYIFVVSPTSMAGSADQPLPSSVLAALSPLLAVTVVFNLVPGVLLLAAPGGYRDDRFPGWDLRGVGKNKSFLLLCASDIAGALGNFASTGYVMWWMANGWSASSLGVASLVFTGSMVLGTVLWAILLSRASVHGFSFLIATCLLFFPPACVRAIALEETSSWKSASHSDVAMGISLVTLFYEGLRSSAMWTARIKMLSSSWRLLSFGTILLTVISAMSAASPWVADNFARSIAGVTFISRNEKELADAMVVVLSFVFLAQSALQVLSGPWIHRDMGIVPRQGDRPLHYWFSGLPRPLARPQPQGPEAPSGTMPRGGCGGAASTGDRDACKDTAKRRLPLTFTLGAAVVTFAIMLYLQRKYLALPAFYNAVHFCSDTKFRPQCKKLLTETIPAQAVLDTWTYGPNRYGMYTTARYNCRMRMRNLHGDTFILTESTGTCEVQQCRSSAERLASGERGGQRLHDDVQVWSHTCQGTGRGVIAVHLLEWPWRDVARECEEHLASSGVSAVQISPITEHVLGDHWATRYQPVSFKMESRGGTRDELVDMIRRCKSKGIDVMVDIILNHMAGPYVLTPKAHRGRYCGQDRNASNSSTMPCVGWNGTVYGNREYPNNREDVDRYMRRHFHHYDGNERSNCALPPWGNNRHLCDLNGMPDLDTEQVEVQRMLRSFLLEVFEIGASMLRIDAAMLIYPESLAQILEPIPWDYLVQEFYPDQLGAGLGRDKAFEVGHVTDFGVGAWLTQAIADVGSVKHGWKNRTESLTKWLDLGSVSSSCGYLWCVDPVREDKALVFVDNHDSQRELWKPADDAKPDWKPETSMCQWNGYNIGRCRLNYKHGLEYSLASRFMLAWPWGDSVRLMSSFAWEHFDGGPPGVRPDSLHDAPSSPVRCRPPPTTSPVSQEYDALPDRWNCEHRWPGMLAMARFRRVVKQAKHKVHSRWHKEGGFIGFAIGDAAFVALSRGYNEESGMGTREDYNLTGTQTVLPEGLYCNLAAELGPVPALETWDSICRGGGSPPVQVGSDGVIDRGFIPSGGMVALLLNYTTVESWSAAPRGRTAGGGLQDEEVLLAV